jgi:hypothetical protein
VRKREEIKRQKAKWQLGLLMDSAEQAHRDALLSLAPPAFLLPTSSLLASLPSASPLLASPPSDSSPPASPPQAFTPPTSTPPTSAPLTQPTPPTSPVMTRVDTPPTSPPKTAVRGSSGTPRSGAPVEAISVSSDDAEEMKEDTEEGSGRRQTRNGAQTPTASVIRGSKRAATPVREPDSVNTSSSTRLRKKQKTGNEVADKAPSTPTAGTKRSRQPISTPPQAKSSSTPQAKLKPGTPQSLRATRSTPGRR